MLDELWLDASDKLPTIDMPHKIFMWRRASYTLQAFFSTLSNAANSRMRITTGLARLSVDAVKRLLKTRGAQALNNELRGAGQLAGLSALDERRRNGFVGVVFSQEILDDLVRSGNIAPGLGVSEEGVARESSLAVPDLMRLLLKNKGSEVED